jgi:hypothetical protein
MRVMHRTQVQGDDALLQQPGGDTLIQYLDERMVVATD